MNPQFLEMLQQNPQLLQMFQGGGQPAPQPNGILAPSQLPGPQMTPSNPQPTMPPVQAAPQPIQQSVRQPPTMGSFLHNALQSYQNMQAANQAGRPNLGLPGAGQPQGQPTQQQLQMQMLQRILQNLHPRTPAPGGASY